MQDLQWTHPLVRKYLGFAIPSVGKHSGFTKLVVEKHKLSGWKHESLGYKYLGYTKSLPETSRDSQIFWLAHVQIAVRVLDI